ncbi:MAG: pyrimidine/purine nucleoside phosphorylase [Verrucomicrobiota bacterium]
MSTSSFPNVTVDAKANVYFDGRVVSHTVHFEDGSKKTLGLIYPGEYHFGTAAPERMDIIAGSCKVVLVATSAVIEVSPGGHFDVAGNSGFSIAVSEGICEYVCSFLK